MADKIISDVEDYIATEQLLTVGAPVYVGFSGGVDSTALLIILSELNYQVRAVHFNHNLRGGESDNDEEGCRIFCQQAEIPFESIGLEIEQNRSGSESIEMAARRMRLEYWQSLAPATVALGHHKDDALETCILNFCRGGNVTSLAGLRPSRRFSDVNLIRPLLCLTRQGISDFLESRGVTPPGHDSSNDSHAFKRNQVRHDLLPVLDKISGGRQSLYRSLENLSTDAAYIESAVPPTETLTPSNLKAQPEAIRFRMLRDWIIEACQEHDVDAVVSGKAIARVFEVLDKTEGKPRLIDLDDSYYILITKRSLELIAKDMGSFKGSVEWNWQEDPRLELDALGVCLVAEIIDSAELSVDGECFDADSLPPILIVRGRKNGDTLVPFGSRRPKKLKKLISDSKLDYLEKKAIIVIEAPTAGILWVPGVKRAEVGRVRKGTSKVLRLAASHS